MSQVICDARFEETEGGIAQTEGNVNHGDLKSSHIRGQLVRTVLVRFTTAIELARGVLV